MYVSGCKCNSSPFNQRRRHKTTVCILLSRKTLPLSHLLLFPYSTVHQFFFLSFLRGKNSHTWTFVCASRQVSPPPSRRGHSRCKCQCFTVFKRIGAPPVGEIVCRSAEKKAIVKAVNFSGTEGEEEEEEFQIWRWNLIWWKKRETRCRCPL